MARPGLLRHRKFIRLARLLQSDALALGHLGIIWDACYESGDDVIGTAADLEYLARWSGDDGLLASFMVESGFIDVLDDGTYRVHDLYDHAPEYVQRRMEREQQRRDKGVTISELRAEAGRKGGTSKGKQTEANDFHLLSKCQANESKRQANGKQTAQLPHPLPAPSTQHPTQIGEVSPITPQANRRQRKQRIVVTAVDILKDLEIPESLGHQAGSKQAVLDWLDHKDRIGNQYASAKSFAVELSRWANLGSERFAAAVAYSIGKEWKGIYEEQTNGKTASGRREQPRDAGAIHPDSAQW